MFTFYKAPGNNAYGDGDEEDKDTDDYENDEKDKEHDDEYDDVVDGDHR